MTQCQSTYLAGTWVLVLMSSGAHNFLTLLPFNTAPHVMMTSPHRKIIVLLFVILFQL